MDRAAERLSIAPDTPWWGEHRCRYRFARRFAPGARVLDVACGAGFGVAMLADAGALWVTGADIDSSTVSAAQSRHSRGNTLFLAADGTHLPFPSAAFDLVTSFETLEHVHTAEALVGEIRRVLTPSGTLVLSTPNRDYTELNGHVCTNPYHVREYTRGELSDLLQGQFASIRMLGQKLSADYRLSPFASDHQRLYLDVGSRIRLLLWKLQNKLPFPLKDRLSRLFAGHPFYPDEEHYEFSEEGMALAPVLVALCRP